MKLIEDFTHSVIPSLKEQIDICCKKKKCCKKYKTKGHPCKKCPKFG